MRATSHRGIAALCISAAFGLGACNDQQGSVLIDESTDVAYAVIAQGSGTGGTTEQYQLVESQSVLTNLFYSVGQRSDAAPPVIDFTREVAYFATLGSTPTLGYGITVEGLRRTGGAAAANDALEVDIRVFSPGPGCFNATVVTVPYVIISIPREAVNRGVINVNRSEKLTSCGG
jgi:hypothetical protein